MTDPVADRPRAEQVWAIVRRTSNRLVLFDGRCPVFWKRRVAKEAATAHGFTAAEVRIIRVSVRPT